MKIILLVNLLTFFSILKLNAQSNDWTRDDRSNIYNDCMAFIGKYPNLSAEQKESMSICYLDEITKKYTKKDFNNKIDIEIKKIRETTLTLCSKNLGFELSETKNEEPKKQESVKESSSTNPTKEMLTGHWKDENSEFWLFETGDYKMQYAFGKTAKGTWKIDGNQLNLYKDKLFGTSEKEFKILVFTNEKFVYQSVKSKKDTFIATRIK